MPQPYLPQSLPLTTVNWSKHVALIGKANGAVARFDGLLQSMTNPLVLLSPLTTQEAVLSSKIEGTQASLNEVLQYEANPKQEQDRIQDIIEVLNYRNAMQFAVKEMEKVPLSLRIMREMHKILMKHVRGAQQAPGEFREIQNWIGKPGSPIEVATYVPPPPNAVNDLIGNLEKYIHTEEQDPLVQLAILHAQFEMIHPFLDGNGRIGRILIPLFLYHKKVLSEPMFYISAYFEAHRDEYYDKLLAVSSARDWNNWIEYFLRATLEQANKNIEKAKAIHSLYEREKTNVEELTRSHYAIRILDFLFKKPVFRLGDFVKGTRVKRNSAHSLLSKLAKGNVLRTVPSKGRVGNTYLFGELLDIVQ